jgi:heme/copper-type cytochrome/quinol oxidase subunit 3
MSQTLDPQVGQHSHGVHVPKPSLMPLVWGAGFFLIALAVIIGSTPVIPGTTILLSPPLAGAGLVVILVATGGWLVGNIRERVHGSETPEVAAKFAMWFFLGTEVVIFGALIARVVIIWIQSPQLHLVLTKDTSSLLLVSLNTFILLVSSLCVVLGLSSVESGNSAGLVGWLSATAVLGAAFVAIQGFEFTKLVSEGVIFGSSQFASAFYFLTGNHGLHVIIGVIWCLTVIVRAVRGGFTKDEHLGVEVFGLYWHFVDVVWILIFTLVYLI